jgi:hypothetical protein
MTDKETLIQQARAEYKGEFDLSKMDPSQTIMGPCLWRKKMFVPSSWFPNYPMFPHYIERFESLGKKYLNSNYTPIDLPKITIPDFEQFKSIFEREAIELNNIETQEPAEFKGMHIHMASTLDYVMHDLYDIKGNLSVQIPDIIKGYPNTGLPPTLMGAKYNRKIYKDRFFNKLICQILELFPIYSIANILIVKPIDNVKPRREQTWVWNCPTEFRTVLHDENTEPTFYLRDIENNCEDYINLPNDTNTFAFSNGRKIHGIDYYSKDCYYLIVNAIWDSKKTETLLDRSIEKYGIL